jgi:hypothetical protein
MMNTKTLLKFPATSEESTGKSKGKPNPEDHNIWLNNDSAFWLHSTVHFSDFTAARVRLSLQTTCVEEARQRRDLIFSVLHELEGFIASPSAKSKHGLTRHFKHAA